jgi:hypothetical protein
MKQFPNRWINIVCCVFFIVNLFPAVIGQQLPVNGPWYVATTGNDAQTCTSPATPCATINATLSKASSGDTVYVAAGTYTGSGSEVVLINKTITLSGGWNSQFDTQSGRSVIDGGGQRRGITINADAIASIERFTVQHGTADHGGGISNVGRATLQSITVINNSAPAPGTDDLGAGGGIYNNGSLTVTVALIANNYAGGNMGGGGIYSTGKLWLKQGAVISNSAQVRGGGISAPGDYWSTSWSGRTFIENTTIARNAANYGGGLYNYPADDMTILNSTISENQAETVGGGIADGYGGVKLQNSILGGNIDTRGNPDCFSATSLGYNLIQTMQSTQGCAINAGPGDLWNVDPKLIRMGEYYALDPHSPALDAGNPAGCTDYAGNTLTIDQRGTPRPLDSTADGQATCDVGAYEYDPDRPIQQIFLPSVSLPIQGIYGRVTENGVPASGIALDLRFYNGSSWSTAASTTTAADGTYRFLKPASLTSGQFYYVRYLNTTTPGRLFTWHTPAIGNYVQGTPIPLKDFDIADVGLVQPASGEVPVPQTFQWTPRAVTPSDSYEFEVFDPYTGELHFYTGPLGYVSSYTINTLPFGLSVYVLYGWDIVIYSPDGGFGSSYYARLVKFTSYGTAPDSLAGRNKMPSPTTPRDLEPFHGIIQAGSDH